MINLSQYFKLVFITWILCASSTTASAYWPGLVYDDSIPTHQDVLGYAAGEKITNHQQMLNYFEALVKADPDHIKTFSYGQSWEGRELIYAAIGSKDNIAKLEQLSTDIKKLADPRQTSASEAADLVDSMPAFVWLAYGVHGNEISSTDAAMMTAYHLLASKDQPMTQAILENTLIFIDPLQNPDGRSRFTSRYYASLGLEPSADRYSVDHNEPWPNGRSNHYLFDMNRDWLAMTQPETQGRIKALNKFLPQVVIDLHEMGGDMSYYFAPAAEPVNPLITENQIENMSLIGQNHARHFDHFGYDYFTREIFDAFYPGYGDTWPTFYGAAASTYEVGSARGEVFQKKNGKLYTYKDSVQKHFVASVSTAEATANNRRKILEDFYQYQVSAIKAGQTDQNRYYIIPQQQDRAGAHKLATLLAKHGVEIKQSDAKFKSCGKNIGAGSYVIDTAQPRGRFVTAALKQQIDMNQAFIDTQEQRRERNLNDQIYDLTAWSLPLMFNLEVLSCNKIKTTSLSMLDVTQPLPPIITNKYAHVAFLVPWGDMAAGRFLTHALRAGIKLKSTDLPFTLADKTTYPAGTLIIETKHNGADLIQQITRIAEKTGAIINGVDSSWVTEGPNFGSMNVVEIHPPKIAMAWDEPTSSLSAGNSRFVIERQLDYPVTAIRTKHLNHIKLDNYDVLILPSGNYASVISKKGVANITAWIKGGGVLLTFNQATAYATSQDVNWLSSQIEYAFNPNKTAKQPAKKEKNTRAAGKLLNSAAELETAISSEAKSPDSIAGVLARVAVDQDHWLTAGVKPEVIGMVTGNKIYTPIKLSKGKNLAWFKGPDELLASGYMWQENQKQLAFKPFLIHQSMGKGMVIAYTQEPTLRAFLDGLHVMLSNSIFRAAAHSGKLR